MIYSFPFSKLQIVSFTNFNGNPAFRYFSLILFNSLLESDAICLARCRSPELGLRLYQTRIFELQCTGNFVDLLKTCVVISPFYLTSSVSKNVVRLTSNLVFIF